MKNYLSGSVLGFVYRIPNMLELKVNELNQRGENIYWN
jgi:hypothetical protein